jgi:hypothetical protein
MSSPLDRTALERVLARAAELQAQSSSADADGALSDDQILDLGKEVGLAPDTLRQALAEERGRVALPVGRGVTGGWFGGATISATRVVPGTPASVLAALDEAFSGELRFEVSRRFADRTQWTPRRGFLDTMKSEFVRVAEGVHLRTSSEVSASVGLVTAQRTHVRLDASLADIRRQARSLTVALSLAGAVLAAAAGIAVGTNSPGLLLPASGALFAGITSLVALQQRAAYRRRAMQVGTALEQMLDRLEFGPTKRPRGIVDKLLG